jgi:hypothetical protein
MGSKCRKIYKHIVGDHTVYFINKDGRYHNLDGPAFLRFIPPNFTRISLMEYYIDGKFCNNDGPAIIYFYKSGKINARFIMKMGLRVINSDRLCWIMMNSAIYLIVHFLEMVDLFLKQKGIKQYNSHEY